MTEPFRLWYCAAKTHERGSSSWLSQLGSESVGASCAVGATQGNDEAAKKGIGVVMRRDGTIIRRGLGQVNTSHSASIESCGVLIKDEQNGRRQSEAPSIE